MQLQTVEPHGPGIGRRRRGKGFSYLDLETGAGVDDADHLERIAAMVLPPAWRDVWITYLPDGHIQAVGTDKAGRRQYRYHEEWTRQRAAEKFLRVARLGEVMPDVRTELGRRLQGDGLERDRVMAGAVWLLDLGVFRVGGDEYAAGDDASFGLATLRREHAVAARSGTVEFKFVAKAGVPRTMNIHDAATHRLVTSLKRRRGGGDDLLAYRTRRGRSTTWHDVTAEDIDSFAAMTGDMFYAHTDPEAAAANPLFGGIVAHGYWVLSRAAGLFVDPAPGPVLANTGLEGLRFTTPVRVGDRIRVALTCKALNPREHAEHGEVRWDATVSNDRDQVCATYTLLTLVAKQPR